MRVVLHPKALKSLLQIPKPDRIKILVKFSELEALSHPLQHRNVIKLAGRKTEDFRLRIGDYRAQFTFEQNSAFVTYIEQRQAGY